MKEAAQAHSSILPPKLLKCGGLFIFDLLMALARLSVESFIVCGGLFAILIIQTRVIINRMPVFKNAETRTK